MYTFRKALVAVTTAAAALTLVAAPAMAAQKTLHDPAGDAWKGGLDIKSVTLHNQPHSLVATVRFAKAGHGYLVVSIDPRNARGLQLDVPIGLAEHHYKQVLTPAFTDKNPHLIFHEQVCPDFHVTWNAKTAQATLRLPSKCLHHGHYGAVRFSAATHNGDWFGADYAPRKVLAPWGHGGAPASRWVSRG